jgi:hypothetical protein
MAVVQDNLRNPGRRLTAEPDGSVSSEAHLTVT